MEMSSDRTLMQDVDCFSTGSKGKASGITSMHLCPKDGSVTIVMPSGVVKMHFSYLKVGMSIGVLSESTSTHLETVMLVPGISMDSAIVPRQCFDCSV